MLRQVEFEQRCESKFFGAAAAAAAAAAPTADCCSCKYGEDSTGLSEILV